MVDSGPVSRRDFVALGVAWTLAPGAQSAVPASFPKSLKIIVPYSAGGGTDIIARHLADKLRAATGLSVLVDNKPGANGVIGTDLAAKSPPDGSTIVLVVNTHLLNPLLMSKLPYDTFKDFMGVTQVAVSPLVVVTSVKNEGATARDFAAKARAAKLPYSYGSSENMTRLVGSMFVKAMDIDAVHIPYKGGGPLMTDVAAGTTTIGVTSVLSAKQLIDGGRLKALAITGTERSKILPHTPTMKEMGFDTFDKITTSYSLYAPAATPAETLAALQTMVTEVVNGPEMVQILAAQAALPLGNSVADFNRQIKTDFEFWKKLAIENNLEKD
ncbi:MAG: tripartite tricarboxylate transporter substrate-binding protein [Burkholderiaceae bacterium]|nr:tripartite tricarboxylate transporter substrate-binding protein [Burkholderiaceae bacterium]